MNFMQRAVAGEFADVRAAIYEHIDRWHEETKYISVHDYLGMTQTEYARWAERPEYLPAIIEVRRRAAWLQAQLADLEFLLSKGGGGDILGRMSLEARCEDIRKELAELDAKEGK